MLKNTGKLGGHTIFITGASRGIGKAIALKAARDGANIVLASKTAHPHPKLPGTIYSAGEEIEKVGGRALPCIVDVRIESEVKKAVEDAVNTFGGIDIVVNNASAISLTNTETTPMKTFDLMHQINSRGTYLVSKYCIPHLMKSKHPHILNMSPPLSMKPVWFQHTLAYTLAKYGMSMCALGMAEELREHGIACNTLWPRTVIHTAAMEMIGGGSGIKNKCRKPEIMADAAYVMMSRDPKSFTGNFAIDEAILREEGITDFDPYACVPGSTPMLDGYIDGSEIFMKAMTGSKKASSKANNNPDQSTPIAQVFKKMESLLNAELVDKTKAVYSFEVKGSDDVTHWFLNMKEGTGSCGPVTESSPKGDVTLKMNEENFLKMFRGEMQPTAAFMSGKLKISGDMGKAMKLEKVMGLMKSKI